MFDGRDPSLEIVCEANRAFVVESGPIRPIIDFPTSKISGRKFKFFKRNGTMNTPGWNIRCRVPFRVPCAIMSVIFQLLRCRFGYVNKDLFG